MKNIKKFVLVFVLSFCFALLLSLFVGAEPIYPRVVDNANLLTVSEEAVLLSKLDRISEEYSQDIVVVTTESLGVKTPEKFAREFYEKGTYGFSDKYNGILLLISMEYRDYYILTSGEALEIFSEGDLDSLEDAFIDNLSEGYYFDAFCAFADKCEYIIKYDGRLSPIWILIALVFGAAVSGFVLWLMISKHKAVKAQRTADSYMLRHTFRLDRSRDIYLYSHVTRTTKPQNNSSGGRSYGGRGGKF